MSFIKKTNTERRRLGRGSGADQNVSAYSYHNVRSDQEEVVGRKANRSHQFLKGSYWLNRFGLILLVIVAAVCLISVLDLSPNPRIVLLGSDTDNQLYKPYEAAFLARSTHLFKSSPLNHNKITVDTNSITNKLIEEFPEFNNISIILPLIDHQPVIYAQPGSPALVLSNNSGQFLLSQNGIAILSAKSSDSFDYLNLPLVNDQSGLQISLGQAALTSQDVSFIQVVVAQLAAKQFKISSMTLPTASSELDVYIAGKPYFVKFNLQDDNPKLQAGSFLASIHYLTSQNITPGKYIDVRTDGRVYYQ